MKMINNLLVFIYEDDWPSKDFVSTQLKNGTRYGITQFANASHLCKNLVLTPDLIIIDLETYTKRKEAHGEDVFKELESLKHEVPVVVLVPEDNSVSIDGLAAIQIITYKKKGSILTKTLKRLLKEFKNFKSDRQKNFSNKIRRIAALTFLTVTSLTLFLLSQ